MTQPIPPEHAALIPHLKVKGARQAIEFYKKAFGAEVMAMLDAEDGERLMHAAITIAGNVVFIADDFPEYCNGKAENPLALGGSSVTMHRYVENCDAAMEKAISAGATVLCPATDMFWGDRYGVVQDPFGHTWSLATHQKDMTTDEMKAAYKEMMKQFQGQ
ncbi:VOC family protein [Planctomicrobium sp. SH668]|uniref:VOC family protein n=1 Tax=Planctomicrobium sp. SH668 TaxID=3448126 RepID=UPI003F5ADFB9